MGSPREELAQEGDKKEIFQRSIRCGITNGIAKGNGNHYCDQFIRREINSYFWYSRSIFACGYAKGLKRFIKIWRKIFGYNVSDQSITQKDREVQKLAKGLIYFGITCHIWVHRIGSTGVQIILININ